MKEDWICNIEALIRESGFRKDYLAGKIGVTTRQLRKYEKFDLFIPTEPGLLLAEELGRKFDDFYKRKKAPTRNE